MTRAVLDQLGAACAEAVAVVLLRDDGVPVELIDRSHGPEDVGGRPSALGPQLAGVLAEVRRTAQVLEYGEVEEIAVSSDRLTLLVRAVGLRHYLALVLASGAKVGRGRCLLRIYGSRLGMALA